ncbi:DUF6625 family protein [Altericista sp. CCNU0014]|uniref:DUF6625 family protein n=1 Tax=Altericista sp. CCNU0014 TaxID=3082949 RepID=UPI00384B4ECA
MSRIALVIVYVGPLPDYFRYFSESVARNRDIDLDVYLFTDRVSQPDLSGNLKQIPLTLEQFNKLASEKLEIPVSVNWGYKLSEFKPAFGVIFEEYLKDYDFWGYCDLDIIFGKISHFITEEILTNYDIINASEMQLVGHFILFRNNSTVTNLFRQTEDYIKIFTDNDRYYNFDESCMRFYRRPFSFEELQETSQLASLYDIVMNLKEKYDLKIYMNVMCREEPPFDIIYRDGTFFDSITQKEFLYFHFVKAKLFYLFYFYLPPMQNLPDEFSIVTGGIIPGSPDNYLNKLRWDIERSLFILKYFLKKIWSKLKFESQQTLPGWERRELNGDAKSSE